MGVFACGWLGWVFALLPVFDWGVCVLACVRLLGGGGAVWSRRPFAPACLVGVHAFGVGVVGVCAACACGVGGGR